MKKKCMAALILTAAMAVQPVCAFGASSSMSTDGGSVTTSGSSGGSSHSSSKSTVSVSSTGVKTTGATTSKNSNGSLIGVAVNTTTTKGEPVTVNARGEAVIGNTAVSFAEGTKAATAGLPDTVVAAINGINGGKSLSEVVKDVDLAGFHALTGTHAILTKDASNGSVKTGEVEVSLYVPNLVEGLADLSVLFYDNAKGTWQLLPAVKIDPVTKSVAVNIPGSGTLSVVYKK